MKKCLCSLLACLHRSRKRFPQEIIIHCTCREGKKERRESFCTSSFIFFHCPAAKNEKKMFLCGSRKLSSKIGFNYVCKGHKNACERLDLPHDFYNLFGFLPTIQFHDFLSISFSLFILCDLEIGCSSQG